MSDHLGKAYPGLAEKLQKRSFASLPTPVSHHALEFAGRSRTIVVKHDDQTSTLYGGNKIRKLEYIFQRAIERDALRVATFGTVGSNHALATAIIARSVGLGCTCFLAHQKPAANIPAILDAHRALGTELVPVGGGVSRLDVYRRYLQNRRVWVIPLGGSSWLGAVGFVNAGMEIAAQIEAGELETPKRIYMANGTMGSVAGLALGLALANLPTEVHAIRITETRFANWAGMLRLISKTASLLNRIDPAIPANLAGRCRIVWRDDFVAGGYANVDDATLRAVEFAKDNLGLSLETTYTGKTMAALLHDLEANRAGTSSLFWNTYNSRSLPTPGAEARAPLALPESFKRYYEISA